MARVMILTEACAMPVIRLDQAHQMLIKELEKAGHEVALHAYQTVDPFSLSFCDVMIFSYTTFTNTIPLEMMAFFTRLKQVRVLTARVYTLAFTDLYEPSALLSTSEVIHMWCKRRSLIYCGGMIVTADFMLGNRHYRRQYRRDVTYFVESLSHEETDVMITSMSSLSEFLKKGNQFSQKQIAKRQEELSKK